MPVDEAEHLTAMLRALAHPLRLRIMALLCAGEVHVGGLAEHLAAPQAIVSQQLRILRMAGLVLVTRQGGLAVYRLADERVCRLLDCMAGCAGERGARPAAQSR